MESLIESYRALLAQTSTSFVRYLHDVIAWDARLVAILGARGVGKTTLLLQHIKLHDAISESLYVSADDLYFTTHTLYDLATWFYHDGGKRLYIDEVHKYPDWSREIKNIYDHLPGLRVVYTGSSILDLEQGGADLSRRKLQYYMYGLSFREYLNISSGLNLPAVTLDDVLTHKVELPSSVRPLQRFKSYLREGYYPFFAEPGYLMRLQAVVAQSLEVDIPRFANMSISTSAKLRRLLYIIAQSVPFKPNHTKLANDIGMSRNDIKDVLVYLEKAGLISQLRADTGGIRLLGKVDKVYLNNPNLAYALSTTSPDVGNLRETAFYALTRVAHDVTTSSVADFVIQQYTFEVGGQNKTQRQIAGVENAFVVKDDIEYGGGKVLPLWTFGMMY